MNIPLWLVYAFASALCASLVSVLGKKGVEHLDSNMATAIRSTIMTVFLVGFVTLRGAWSGIGSVGSNAMMWISLSGIAGATSWLFQFKALQLGEAIKVAPIDKLSMPIGIVMAVLILGEKPSYTNWAGISLIVIGAYLAAIKS
jgi:transporter family protein